MTINRNALFISIVGIVVLTMVLFIGYLNFPLFQREDTPMAKITLAGSVIDIKFVQSGATTQDHIEVTMTKRNSDARVLSNIVRMNFLLGYQICNDTLDLTLKDTIFANNKTYTYKIPLPK